MLHRVPVAFFMVAMVITSPSKSSFVERYHITLALRRVLPLSDPLFSTYDFKRFMQIPDKVTRQRLRVDNKNSVVLLDNPISTVKGEPYNYST